MCKCIFCKLRSDEKVIEHIIPESFGNKEYILKNGLVCNECNNRFSKFEPEIIGLMKNGSQRQFIAKRYGVTSAGLLHWLKRHDLVNIEPEP